MFIPTDERSDDLRKIAVETLYAVSFSGGRRADHGKDYGHDQDGKGWGTDES